MSGIYSVSTAPRLFEKLVRDFTEFCKCPSEDGIWNVIFPLYHLREWICPGGAHSYKNKPEDMRTNEELLHERLNKMPEYRVVRSLCNGAKHYSVENGTKPLAERTEVLEGFRVGLGRVGDSLGVTHFMVDDREIRDVFWAVYEVYCDHFRAAEPGSQAHDAR